MSTDIEGVTNTGDGFLTYIIVVFGLLFMVLIGVYYFGRKVPKFE